MPKISYSSKPCHKKYFSIHNVYANKDCPMQGAYAQSGRSLRHRHDDIIQECIGLHFVFTW